MPRNPAMLLLLAIVLILSVSVTAATPQLISYQGYIEDAEGNPVDGTRDLTFAIYDQGSSGSLLWSESHTGVPVNGGVFAVELGSIVDLPDTLFNRSSCFLGITVGTDPEMEPRAQLLSVPYAIRVDGLEGATAGKVSGQLELADVLDGGSLVITGDSQDSVVMDPNEGMVMRATDKSGNLRMSIDIHPDETASFSFYDPADVASFARSPMAGPAKRVFKISRDGLFFFGASELDTTFRIDTLGNIRGKGRLSMGFNNSNSGNYAMVLGFNNTVEGDSSSILGGYDNSVSGFVNTIVGGVSNDIHSKTSFIAGGLNNLIDSGAVFSFIGSGKNDTITAEEAFIGGGANNQINGLYGSILGGRFNLVDAPYASVLGGLENSALGDKSAAIGSRARANHNGSIVISASASTDLGDSVSSGTEAQMVLRADNGIYITNASEVAPSNLGKLINTPSGAYLSAGGTWTDGSSREYKENLHSIDRADVLRKIENLPLYRWNYKSEGALVEHIGPMAEDFYAAFSLGNDDKGIAGVDRNGVALAAIQELIDQNKKLSERIEELEQKIERLESGSHQ